MTFVVRLIKANLNIANTESNLKCYCTITIGHQRKYSSQSICQDRKANWNEQMDFKIDCVEYNLWIQLWIKQFDIDQKIGQCNIDLTRHYKKSEFIQNQRIDLTVGQNITGKLHLSIQYKPSEMIQNLRNKNKIQQIQLIRNALHLMQLFLTKHKQILDPQLLGKGRLIIKKPRQQTLQSSSEKVQYTTQQSQVIDKQLVSTPKYKQIIQNQKIVQKQYQRAHTNFSTYTSPKYQQPLLQHLHRTPVMVSSPHPQILYPKVQKIQHFQQPVRQSLQKYIPHNHQYNQQIYNLAWR